MSNNHEYSPVNPAMDLDSLRSERMAEILDPAAAALLIVDMQRDFLASDGKTAGWGQNVAAMQAIVPVVETVIEQFRDQGRPVIWTKTYEDPGSRNTAGWDRYTWFEGCELEEVACLEGSVGAELYLKPAEEDTIIEKRRVSAAVDTNLIPTLQELQIETVVVAGVKTQRCVARTVQDLAEQVPNLHVVVLSDGVASDNVIAHDAMLAELSDFWPPVISSDELRQAWSKNDIPLDREL